RRSGRWLRAAVPHPLPLRNRPAPGWPIVALLALGLLAAAGAAAVQAGVLATGATGATDAARAKDAVASLSWIAAIALVLAVPALLARCAGDERRIWRLFLAGVLVLAATGAVAPLVAPEASVAVATTGGALVACCLLYQGLIHWNRVRTLTSDPSDWLNGVSSVLANAA